MPELPTNLTSMFTECVFFILACVGRFGVHCENSCPNGHYGIGCINKCACDFNLCDEVLGCPTTATGTQLERFKAIILFELIYITYIYSNVMMPLLGQARKNIYHVDISYDVQMYMYLNFLNNSS